MLNKFVYYKNILCISNHGDMVGGGEHSFLDLLCNLPPIWQPIALIPSQGELSSRLYNASIETHIIPLSTIRPWTLTNIIKTAMRLSRFCKQIKPALIYANGPRAAFYACITKIFHHLPIIWHCRISQEDIYLDWLLFRLSNLIIANSHATAKRFKFSSKKVEVIYNGIDLRQFEEDPKQAPDIIQPNWRVVLCVARASKDKRHDIILTAFEKAAEGNPDLHLVCVGGQDKNDLRWWEYLQRETKQSPISNQIHWAGEVEDTVPWYRSAHVCVLGTENESFGRVLVEAMACGVPVIATRSGGVPEIVRHGEDGILVTPGNVDEMAGAMGKILTNDDLRKRLARSAVKRSECFGLDTHIKKMMRIFEKSIST